MAGVSTAKLDSVDAAIFARNHPAYLEEARAKGAANSNERIVFRAKAKWATAERQVGRRGPLPIT